MTMRRAPPTRRSNSGTELVKCLGQNHCASMAGSGQACHTSARGASNTRTISTVPSPNVSRLLMSLSVVGALDCRNVELLHFHEGVHHPRRLVWAARHQLRHDAGHDLPGQLELVLEPAALNFGATIGGKLAPVIVD